MLNVVFIVGPSTLVQFVHSLAIEVHGFKFQYCFDLHVVRLLSNEGTMWILYDHSSYRESIFEQCMGI